MNIKIAAVSMEPSTDKEKNLEMHAKYIADAAKKGVKLIAFPEVSVNGFTKEFTITAITPQTSYDMVRGAEAVPDGPSTEFMIKQAKEHNMYICYGILEKDTKHCEKVYNTAALVGPEGFIGKYHKVHLVGTERLYLFPGDDFHVFETPIGKIGLMVCYDQAFPEAARCLKLLGAEIVICPTAWPIADGTRSENDSNLKLFQALGNSRAFENQFIFVDTNQFTALDRNWPTCGHSRIVDPNGKEIASTGYDESMAIAEVDVEDEVQKGFARWLGMGCTSFMRDLRSDVYVPIYTGDKNQ